jgi:hypothetical protein
MRPLRLGVSDPVGAEGKPQRAGEGVHFGSDDSVRAGAGGEDDAGVVDNAHGASAIHEAHRLAQEVFGLEAGEAGVVLNEQPARIGQDQARALHGDRLVCHHQTVRRGVVLHLLAGSEVILARAPRRSAQPRLSDPARQGAVGNFHAFLSEQLLDADHVAAGAREGVLELGQYLRLAGRRSGGAALAQDAAHRITREFQQAADLVQAPALLLENACAVADLGRYLARHTS